MGKTPTDIKIFSVTGICFAVPLRTNLYHTELTSVSGLSKISVDLRTMALSNNLFIAVSPWFGGKLGLFGFLSDLWSHNLKYSSDSPGMQDDRQPLVSIITIVYNGEKHIADCVRSVQRQKYPNLQYIVVDGGSMDNTLAILKQFPDVITDLISEKDEGISDAFNKGILRARGRIIGLINADDWYEDGAVEMAVKAMTDADIAYGDLQLWKDGSPDFILTGDHS